ncbi:hypothetical protein K466DRAFT_272104 [Polyporus arcularius HHB13444]|uniref:Uncharacterized protein n=1 Tax=Polyporus arcularius HHB13444 TaxID=1314778 RepID=A0A5C3P0X4_9APHY|nr:hypothetical protein K466DRAFT_272104 [Polyporus arcularius HHB13444]
MRSSGTATLLTAGLKDNACGSPFCRHATFRWLLEHVQRASFITGRETHVRPTWCRMLDRPERCYLIFAQANIDALH